MNDYDMGAATAFKQLTQSARDTNLTDYFLNSGYTTERHGTEVYIKEYAGLCVNTNTNKWYSHYDGVGGSNSIDCLVKICGRDFKQAVLELTGRDVGVSEKTQRCKVFMERPWLDNKSTSEPVEKSERKFEMPERGENMRRLFAYFCQSRKIPASVVEELVKADLLYQSAGQVATTVDGVPQIAKPPNAVFVHRDEHGEAVGGEVQGVNSYKRYKGVVAGTGDSVFTFSPTADKTNTAYLFESGIDLMSYYALADKSDLKDVSLISMAGLKPTVPKQLQADGVSVLSFVDNDDAGRKFESDNGFKRGSDVLEKAGLNDWNDALRNGITLISKSVSPEVESSTTARGGVRK